MRSLGPTESGRRSHASVLSRQYCGDISGPQFPAIYGHSHDPQIHRSRKAALKWRPRGGARLSGGDTPGLGEIVMILNAESPTPQVALETLSAIMESCRPRWAFPGNTRTSGCVPPLRPSLDRRRGTARQLAVGGVAMPSNGDGCGVPVFPDAARRPVRPCAASGRSGHQQGVSDGGSARAARYCRSGDYSRKHARTPRASSPRSSRPLEPSYEV